LRGGSAMFGSMAGGLTARTASAMLRAPGAGVPPASAPAEEELALPPSLHAEYTAAAAAAASAAGTDGDRDAPPSDPASVACRLVGLDPRPYTPPEELTALLDFPQVLLAVRNRLDGALSWMKAEATWVEVEKLLMKGADRVTFKRTPVL